MSHLKKLWKIAGTVDGLLYNLNASEQILNLTIFSNFQISNFNIRSIIY